jgi:hypothetical protein
MRYQGGRPARNSTRNGQRLEEGLIRDGLAIADSSPATARGLFAGAPPGVWPDWSAGIFLRSDNRLFAR